MIGESTVLNACGLDNYCCDVTDAVQINKMDSFPELELFQLLYFGRRLCVYCKLILMNFNLQSLTTSDGIHVCL